MTRLGGLYHERMTIHGHHSQSRPKSCHPHPHQVPWPGMQDGCCMNEFMKCSTYVHCMNLDSHRPGVAEITKKHNHMHNQEAYYQQEAARIQGTGPFTIKLPYICVRLLSGNLNMRARKLAHAKCRAPSKAYASTAYHQGRGVGVPPC